MGILAAVAITLAAAAFWGISWLTNMPGSTRKPPAGNSLSREEAEASVRLRRHVEVLASEIGGRNSDANLARAADYIHSQLEATGYSVSRQTYEAGEREFVNVEAELPGTGGASSIVVVGAHYDTASGLPGANDNASGVAATLELARSHAGRPLRDTVRWVFFANEEPPWFQTPGMGSYVYARRCRERNENITAMVSLETIGYYSDAPGSQRYPVGFHPGYPDRGDFLGFVSDVRSAALLRRIVKAFREASTVPSQGAAAPSGIPGVGWSDHWSFWQFGYRAVMVTDTAPYRYPWYHAAGDTPDKLDYDTMARALTGLSDVVQQLGSR